MITNKQQQKINKLLLIYGNKINSYIEQNNYKFSQEYFIQCVVSSDPDKQGKSVKWILNNVLNCNILWEDVESGDESKVYDTLNRFYNTRKQFKDQSLRDINQFKRLGDIAEQLRGFEVIQSNKEIKKEKKEQIYKDTIFLYNQNGYLVVVPKTQEASCFWGLGTEWCTAATRSDNYFDDYNKDGPLYICITPNGKKYQFHKDSKPMDENDNPIDNITNSVLRKLALITGRINSIKEINYLSENECLKLCRSNGKLIKNISSDISNYEECCLEACKERGYAIEYIPRDISNYEECCLEAVKQNGEAIEYIPRDVSNYEECCLEACKSNGFSIKHIPRDISNYEECCLEACKSNGFSIKYIPRDISNYEECCLEGCKSNGYIIQDIPRSISNYDECCLETVKQNGSSIKNIPRDISNYEECCLEACKKYGYSIYYIINNISNYEQCCLESVKQDGEAIEYITRSISNYEQCCLEACKSNGFSIKHIPRDISNYEECCLEGCKSNGYIIECIPRDVSNYEKCCLEACKERGYAIEYIPRDVSNYEECCLEAVKQNRDFIQHIPKDISNYKECLKISQEYKVNNQEKTPIQKWCDNDALKNKEFFNELVIPQVEKKVELSI